MEKCSHLLEERDHLGVFVDCKCVRCGEQICGNYFELKEVYEFVKHPSPKTNPFSQKGSKETVIIAYVIGGILVLASIAATIGAIWEIYFNR
ncbi:MAG: hypothetical protein WCK57_08705 [Verrucomicrobiae bacterium]